ncbi:MAG TPA: LPS assembly lipoprotein LptE [Micavibrio sp.]
MRTFFLTAVLLALGACGFSPLYATHDDAGVKGGFDAVFIDNIADRDGLYLRNALMDRLYSHGRPPAPVYTLTFSKLQQERRDLDITRTSSSTRAQLRIESTMTLKDNATGEVLLTRGLTAITSYNILQSQFTTRVSEDDTRRSALDDIARQVEQQLALYFSREHK